MWRSKVYTCSSGERNIQGRGFVYARASSGFFAIDSSIETARVRVSLGVHEGVNLVALEVPFGGIVERLRERVRRFCQARLEGDVDYCYCTGNVSGIFSRSRSLTLPR